MRLVVAAVGRMKSGAERDLARRYQERASRAGRAIGFKSVDLVEVDESRARRALERIGEEAAALVQAAPKDGVFVLLESGGQALTSEELAKRLGRWRDAGRPAICFVIGGADGLGATVRKKADLTVSFGAVTWPHQLVRIMLFEQLYRAIAILAGHPYHRA